MSDALERVSIARGVSDPKLEESPRVVEPGADILTLHTPLGAGPAPSEERVARLAIREIGRTYFIAVSSIDWIEGADYYAKLHVGGRVHLLREPLRSLEQRLDPTRFARVHRSSIVNLDRVSRMDLWGAGDYVVLLKDGTKLKLSRWYRSRIEEQTR